MLENSGLSKSRVALLDFAIHFTAGIDNINRHEEDTTAIQAVITQLLMEMGYSKLDSYASALAIDEALWPVGGVHGGYTFENHAVTLSGLLTTAAHMIDIDKVPQEVKDKIKDRL